MAAGTLPLIGSELGPCEGVCDHTDCVLTRKMSNASCAICGKNIGYETSFYTMKKEYSLKWYGKELSPFGTVVEGEQLVHALCLHKKMDTDQNNHEIH